jgi:hypothetical protein
MAGVSTGIGFWGSPLWALGGAAALGLVEGALSSSARKQALQYLGIAAERTKGLVETRRTGRERPPYAPDGLRPWSSPLPLRFDPAFAPAKLIGLSGAFFVPQLNAHAAPRLLRIARCALRRVVLNWVHF